MTHQVSQPFDVNRSPEDGRLRIALDDAFRRRKTAGLRDAIRRYTVSRRSDGTLVEHIIIALKAQAQDTMRGRRDAARSISLVGDMVKWCIEAYYEDQQS